jgi:hypothetical protein
MTLRPIHYFTVSIVTVASVACSTTPTESTKVSTEAKVVAQQEHASYLIQVSFPKGSSHLTTAAKDKLDETMQRARRDGTVKDIKVIAWADHEYPSASKKTLSEPQRKLADNRAKAIDDYLKPQTQANIDNYNMAERPNSLQKIASTSDSRIKKSLEDAGIPTTAHDLRTPENASKAMVMLVLKE